MKISGSIGTPELPTKGVRGYTIENGRYNRVGRTKRAHHAPRRIAPTTAEAAVWGERHLIANRRWTSLIFKWWRDGAAPFGQDEWQTLAETLTITNYKGLPVTPTGKQLFTHFHRRSLHAEGWNWVPFQPNPTYTMGPDPVHPEDYPNYPRLPWSPPSNPGIAYTRRAGPQELWIAIDEHALDSPYFGLFYLSRFNSRPGGLYQAEYQTNAPLEAQHINTYWEYKLDLTSIQVILSPGAQYRTGFARWNYINQQPSAIDWITI